MKLAQSVENGLAGLGIVVDNGLIDLRARVPSRIKSMID
jgi:hypothetical protein